MFVCTSRVRGGTDRWAAAIATRAPAIPRPWRDAHNSRRKNQLIRQSCRFNSLTAAASNGLVAAG
jgi:hypothetical protein